MSENGRISGCREETCPLPLVSSFFPSFDSFLRSCHIMSCSIRYLSLGRVESSRVRSVRALDQVQQCRDGVGLELSYGILVLVPEQSYLSGNRASPFLVGGGVGIICRHIVRHIGTRSKAKQSKAKQSCKPAEAHAHAQARLVGVACVREEKKGE